jgi:hypothetical protein
LSTESRLSKIFEDEPTQWGLRGDPHLWLEMGRSFDHCALPSSISALVNLIEIRFLELTGSPLDGIEDLYLARFAHGGMSSGMIARQGFWIQKAIPLLVQRYCFEKARAGAKKRSTKL